MDATAETILRRWTKLDGDRATVKSYVQQVMEYCLPRRATVTAQRTEGQDLHAELFDSTAETALERFATGLYDYMWSPARQNFMLLPPIEDAPSAKEGSRALQRISERISGHLRQSNFEEAFYETALDLGSAGLATMEPSRGLDSLYEFQSHPFEQIVFSENRGGRVDLVLRRFPWTARQIVQEFGEGEARVGKSVWQWYQEAQGHGRERSFELVHAAIPRTEFTPGRRDVWNMPIASLWVSVTDKLVLRRSGWPQMRYLVTRFAKASGEKHGRSPGMKSLPDIKMLNKIEETLIVGAEQAVRPSILDPDNALQPDPDGKIRFYPGSILRYRTNAMNPGVKPEPFMSAGRVDFGHEYAEAKREIVKRAFFNDLFLMLGDDKRRTATEVRTLLAEKLSLLGPAFGLMKVELFDPMVRILVSILAEEPELLSGVPLEYLDLANIRYISTLAIAMEYAELSLIEDALLFLSPLGELDPTIFDNLSFDEICRGFLQKMAWPTGWLKPVGEVKALREARMAAQAQQVQQQMAIQQAAELERLTKRPESGSPAEAMMAQAA